MTHDTLSELELILRVLTYQIETNNFSELDEIDNILHLLSNRTRRRMLFELASGEGNIIRIAKKHRIILSIVKRVIVEFEQEDIVKNQQGRYIFTKKGERLRRSLG